MNYNLNKPSEQPAKKVSNLSSLRKLISLIGEERRNLVVAFGFIFLNSGLSLLGPYLIGYTIDKYVQTKQLDGIMLFAGILLVLYSIAFAVNYIQMRLMGGIGQRMLYSLRNAVFNKLLELPVDFFNQNKAGDLISRINNDTDKVNQFFSQSLMQFFGSLFTMTGAGIILLSINLPLGLAALTPALLIWIFTRAVSPWVKKRNAESMKSTGLLSAEVQESLTNFKVIVVFNRRDYLRQRFEDVNRRNYSKAIQAGIANNIFTPVYTFAGNAGQIIVLALGIFMISTGHFSVGLLISFIAYINNFYNPLRQLAALWSNFQVAMAGWDRISSLLSFKTNLAVTDNPEYEASTSFIHFRDVSFSYPESKEVLHNVNFELERGKTYAFVGPTGGGKTTTASLIARLYDTTRGTVFLDGKDIRSYSPEERTRKIGFILQEPFLFSGTIRDNLLYGNTEYIDYSNEQLI
jgi:ATP-binding cassette, subfamily B, bacterial